jgi:hypothetical protein
LQRILDYNEDDCRAMIVLLDTIRTFLLVAIRTSITNVEANSLSIRYERAWQTQCE